MKLTSSHTSSKTRHGNYVLKKEVPLEELQATLCEWEHEPSGANILHIHNADPENVFALSFRTLPDSSNGVAHILEQECEVVEAYRHLRVTFAVGLAIDRHSSFV